MGLGDNRALLPVKSPTRVQGSLFLSGFTGNESLTRTGRLPLPMPVPFEGDANLVFSSLWWRMRLSYHPMAYPDHTTQMTNRVWLRS